MPTRCRLIVAATIALGGLAMLPNPAATADQPPLRTIAEILTLPGMGIEHGPAVRFQGVVTLLNHAVVLQDGGRGIYCTWVSTGTTADGRELPLELGMRVEATGTLTRGKYAPTVRAVQLRILGVEPLPAPIPLDLGRMVRGGDSALRLSLGGQSKAIVQGYAEGPEDWVLFVGIAGHRLQVKVPRSCIKGSPADLVDAEVEIVGVNSDYHNNRGEFQHAVIIVARSSDLTVTRPPPSAPFEAPLVAIDGLATYRPDPLDGHRVCVEGIMTCAVAGEFCFIQEGQTGIRVDTLGPIDARVGDRVRAAGFVATTGLVAGLTDALIESVGTRRPTEPADIGPDEIAARTQAAAASPYWLPAEGNSYGTLVAFSATLLEKQRLGSGWQLTLSTGSSTITARLPAASPADDRQMAGLQPGSRLQLMGVSLMGVISSVQRVWPAAADILAGAQLVLRSAADIVVVEQPPWWTPKRLAAVLVSVVGALAATAAWSVLLRSQVRRQAGELAATMRSQREATIELETALRERNRLAANLHDTILQTVTGIGYQIRACHDIPAGSSAPDPGRLKVAERMVSHAIQQLRGTVWALHALPPGGQPLAESLDALVSRIREGQETPIRCTVSGCEIDLPETVAANVLLVAQEAIGNALRHAQATGIDVCIRCDDGLLTLTVADDGRGFEVGMQPGSLHGHFGIEGMLDRMQAVAGACVVASSPGGGTTVTATVPLAPAADDLSDRTDALAAAHGSIVA